MNIGKYIKDKGKKNDKLANRIKQVDLKDYDSAFDYAKTDYQQVNKLDSTFLTGRENPYTTVQEGGLNEIAAQKQPWYSKTGSMVGRIGAKTISEIAKMPGVIGGIGAGIAGQIVDGVTGEDNTDFMQAAFNNAWIKGVNKINEDINTELLPVYVKRSVENGDIWSNLGSIDFWATEGADGIGYILSMLAPGAAIGKLGLGSKLVGKAGKYAAMEGKVANAMKALGKSGKFTPKKIDLYTQTMANTLFEAGAEAQGAMDSYEKKLDAQLANGEITQEQFNEGMDKAGEIGRNVFLANAAILVGPNAAMTNMIWGGARNKAVKAAFTAEGKLATKAPLGFKGKLGYGLKQAGKGAAREGLFEEGMQSVAENYFSDPDKNSDNLLKDFGGFAGDLVPSYLDMLGTIEGQKAIALGAIFGGGMSGVMETKQKSQEINQYNKLTEYANNSLDNFYSAFAEHAFETDPETGDVIMEKNEKGEDVPKIDSGKFFHKLNSINEVEKISAMYDAAIVEGDMETVDEIRHQAASQLILPFLMNEELGLDVLKEHLENSSELETMTEVEKSDKKTVIQGIMEQAHEMKKDFEVFKEFAPSVLKFSNENATAEQEQSFMSQLNNSYLGNKQAQHFYGKKVEKNRRQFGEIYSEAISQRNLDETDVDNNASLRADIISKDSRLTKLNEEHIDLTSKLQNKQKENTKFWDNKVVQKEFDKFINQNNKQKKDFETKKEEVGDILKSIENAKNLEELEDINTKTGTDADSVIKNAIKSKRDAFKEEEAIRAEEAAKRQARESEETAEEEDVKKSTKEDLTNILDSYNVDEVFAIPIELVNDYIPGVTEDLEGEYRYHSAMKIGETDAYYDVYMMRADKQVRIPKLEAKPIDTFDETGHNNTTEGSENHDANTPKAEKDKTEEEKKEEKKRVEEDKSVPKNGTLLLSTVKETGKKVFKAITDAFLNYERNPINKKGKPVSFRLNQGNEDKGFGVERWDEAIGIFNKVKKGLKPNSVQKEKLIDNLPITAVITGGIYTPIMTKPTSNPSAYNESTRKLRELIINALLEGSSLEDITTTIDGQYPGMLTISPGKDGKYAENNILELHLFSFLKDSQKKKYLKKNIAMVNDKSEFVFLDNDNKPFYNKEGVDMSKGKGDIYLMIPKANGQKIPLKLNIRKINEVEADLLADLYEIRINDEFAKKNTTIKELGDEALLKKIRETFKKEIKFIGKSEKDLTIKDLVDFFIYDKSSSPKSRVKFSGTGKKGVTNAFVYGNSTLDGAQITDPKKFDRDHFKKWLVNNKRRHIKFKPHHNESSKANMKGNDAYLMDLIESKVLSTNAVVNESTFQGYTHIYLDSNNIEVNGKSQKSEVISKPRQTISNEFDLEAKIKEIQNNKTFIKLNKDGSKYVNTKTGKEYDRVTSYISDKKVEPSPLLESASTIGTKVDELVRDFFNNTLKPSNQYDVSSVEEINKFINKLQEIKDKMDKRGETVLADDIVLYNDEIGIAGTVDLLTYDKKGVIRIYDMKTMRGDNFNSKYRGDTKNKYDTTRYGKSKRQKHTEQLSTYRILLNNTHGLKATTIAVMPIEISYNTGDTKTSKLNMLDGVKLSSLNQVKDIIFKNEPQKKDNISEPSSNLPDSAFGIQLKDTMKGVKVTTNSGNITIREDGKMFFDNGNEVTSTVVKNKALVKKELQEKTLRRAEHNGKKYGVLSDDRIISLNKTTAGNEVFRAGKDRDTILNKAKPQKVDNLSEAIPDGVESNETTTNYLNKMFSSSIGENNSNNSRNSKNKFVNSHEIDNSKEKKEFEREREEMKSKDKIEASKENIKSLMTGLRNKKLLKVKSAKYREVMKGNNQQKFDALSKIAKDAKLSVEELIKNCK